jgi:MSHA pilin protein MshA
MKKLLRSEQGFTLIELIMVIVILGILAIVAIPRYSDLRARAREAAEAGVVGAVRGGIAAAHADSLINNATLLWPASLESTAVAARVFEAILETGVDVASSGWTEVAAGSYTGPTGTGYIYDNTDGSFE